MKIKRKQRYETESICLGKKDAFELLVINIG